MTVVAAQEDSRKAAGGQQTRNTMDDMVDPSVFPNSVPAVLILRATLSSRVSLFM